jgi:alpha-glucosidase
MRWYLLPFMCFLGTSAAVAGGADDGQSSKSPIVATSPNGRIRAELSLERSGAQASVPHIRVSFRGRPVALPSPLGVNLLDVTGLGIGSTVEGATMRSFDDTYTQFPGKRSRVVDHGSEVVVKLRELAAPSRRWEVIIRAYDDGAAFRYRFPAQEGWNRLEISGERTGFRLPKDAVGYSLPLNSFTTSHEVRYVKKPIAEIPKEWLIGLPLLVELPGTGWLALAEANLTDYAGLYLARDGGEGTTLGCRLSPLPKEPNVAVRAALPHESPWRVLMIAENVERLVDSDIILNLGAPCALADTSWIRPGKTTFPWWNGFYEEKVPFKMGLNTATAKYYIDFCAEAGIPYHSLDGLDNVAWYGGPIVPYEGAGITKGIDGLDLQEVIRHAKAKGVRLRLWMHWKAAETHMERAFPLYREWGIEGVMLDFMDRDDQEMVRFLRRAISAAADNQLTVTLHGVGAPTGLERTYPNLLTSEAVMNLEYDKWEKQGIPPEHEVTVPFTRMLAGPLDFHQGSFRGVPIREFQPRNDAPVVMGTPSRMLATYVVFQNHLPMVADYPSAYRGHPALAVLAKIPTTWDDTRCVAGSVGEYVVIARRHGSEWWVGAMNDRQPRELLVPASFLGAGRFHAEIHGDDLQGKTVHRLTGRALAVTAQEVLKVQLESAGGCLIRFTPLPATAR